MSLKDKNLIFKKTSLPPKEFLIRLNKTVDPFLDPKEKCLMVTMFYTLT